MSNDILIKYKKTFVETIVDGEHIDLNNYNLTADVRYRIYIDSMINSTDTIIPILCNFPAENDIIELCDFTTGETEKILVVSYDNKRQTAVVSRGYDGSTSRVWSDGTVGFCVLASNLSVEKCVEYVDADRPIDPSADLANIEDVKSYADREAMLHGFSIVSLRRAGNTYNNIALSYVVLQTDSIAIGKVGTFEVFVYANKIKKNSDDEEEIIMFPCSYYKRGYKLSIA